VRAWLSRQIGNAGLLLYLVKLLFDENLSPKLVKRLAHLFPNSAHVHELGLASSDDGVIWRFAAAQGFVIITKDLDFFDISILKGSPPKMIWLRTGNCSTATVEKLLNQFAAEIGRFNSNPTESLLVLP
jgi:predicted nuclease of predicted toxin-antitoxin system